MNTSTMAHSQWNFRPDDERYASLTAMLKEAKARRERAAQAEDVLMGDLLIKPTDKEVMVHGNNNMSARLTNHAFEQLCSKTRTQPTSTLDLPPAMVAQILNYRIRKYRSDLPNAKILFDAGIPSDLVIRSFTGNGYARIWDYEVIQRVIDMGKEWTVPPAMKHTFNGQKVSSSGLYMGDRDMFIFMVNENNRIKDGTDEGLARGFFLGNSEVGGVSHWLMTFLYRFVCGNHIVWGIENVKRFSLRHVGDANNESIRRFKEELESYSNEAAKPLEAKIKKAQTYRLGQNDQEVEDAVFSKRILTRRTVRAALQAKEQFEFDGDPLTAWGLSQRVTRLSQLEAYADKRNELDQAAGKLLDMVA